MALGVVWKALGVLLECSWSVYKGASRLEERSREISGRSGSGPGRGRGGVFNPLPLGYRSKRDEKDEELKG